MVTWAISRTRIDNYNPNQPKKETTAMATKNVRTFRVKYDNWPARDASVTAKLLEGLDHEAIARRVMPVAFEQHKQQMGGDVWTDAPGRKIVLTKASDGMWEGTRTRDDGRVQEWYIMETTAQ